MANGAVFYCAQCGRELQEKRRDVHIDGALRHFCPTKYALIGGDCLNEYQLDYNKRQLELDYRIALSRKNNSGFR